MECPLRKKKRVENLEFDNITAKSNIVGEDLNNLAKTKRNRRKPCAFRFKTSGECASLETSSSDRIPLILTDIQYLLLHSLLGNLNLSQPSRWYVLENCGKICQTTCLILEDISIQHWEKYCDKMINTKEIFNDIVEILTPSVYNGSLVQELVLVPLSEVDKEDIIKKYGSINLALEARKDLVIMMKAMFPITNDENKKYDAPVKDVFPRTQLILSAWQLVEENYPVPLKGKLKNAYSDYIMSKDEYVPVKASSPMFGLDCEMCMTNAGSELTRVSIVNENHETIYESFVKPYNEITDYLTRFSGITKSLLNDVTKRLKDVQDDIRMLLPPDAILVGQSLNLDLHALKMMHPYIIDTSLIYNFTGERTRKPKLKTLAKEFLNLNIQTGNKGHCSVEDSVTSLKLVQLKLSKSIEFGDAVHINRQQYKENFMKNISTTPEIALSIFNHMIEQRKTSLVVGCDDITGDYHTYLSQAKESVASQLKKGKTKKVKLCTLDDANEVISLLSESVKDYNFAMGHLKINLNSETENKNFEEIDKWINIIWNNLLPNSLFVVIFGGTTTDNGVGMMKIKLS
ncbi:hypothetical protein ACJJTC_014907 [Scirpophaga incertulas]